MDVAEAQRQRWKIYVAVLVVLLLPIVFRVMLRPAPMKTSSAAFEYIESLDANERKAVIVAVDWGPGTAAENEPQTKLVIEHLMRRRIPVVLTSLYILATPFLEVLPQDIKSNLEKEFPGETWEYGKDWVNIGYLPNGLISVQSLAKSDDWWGYLKSDAYGRDIADLPMMQSLRSIKDVSTLVEVTGLQGVFSIWVQFFQVEGHRPEFIHGCTSITIPEAFIFFSSGQVAGFFEGIAGAAWYEELMLQTFSGRGDSVPLFARIINTGTSFAQILVLVLILIGNLKLLMSRA